MPDFLPFLSYVLIATFTPGPNNLMAMSRAGKSGFKTALPFNAGVFTGVFLILMICAFFSGMLLRYMPGIKPYLAVIGALYILWLAYKVYRSDYTKKEDSRPNHKGYLQGVIMQFVNPKAILFCLTVVTSFIIPYYKSVFVHIGFAMALAGTAFTATCCWALFGSGFNRILIRHSKILNAVMALLLVYAAVSLLW